jgi:ketosteroid isomerase-like protein
MQTGYWPPWPLRDTGRAMSKNLDLVRSIYAALKRGDPKPSAWADTEIEFAFVDGPSPGTWIGVPAMIQAWLEFFAMFEGYYTEPYELRELDHERVLVFDHVRGRAKSSSVDLSQISPKGADLWHVRDGKVVKLAIYFDGDRALADLGLAA